MLQELSEGRYELPAFQRPELDACQAVLSRYADQSLGIADASLVVYANSYGTSTIATFDRRHFTMLRAVDGRPFTLLP
jgi:predicted nucleic acid-binding protein